MTEDENIPLPDELDAEEESPYLRRQKAVAVRRSRVSWRLRWIIFGICVILPTGFVGYLLARFALTSDHFLLDSAEDVVVVDNQFVSREEVLSALGSAFGGMPGSGVNLFQLSLSAKRKQVEAIPWVQSATLTRVYPHRLVVQIVERTPVAFANVGGRVSLVDGEGALLDKPESVSFDFPVVTGLDSAAKPEERRTRLELYQEFMRQLNEEAPRAGWLISEVDLSDADDLKALLVQGAETLQVHFGRKDFLDRFRIFLELLPELRKANTKLDSIDLRFRNQIVVSPQTPVVTRGNGVAAEARKE